MSDTLPILYAVDASVDVTGAFNALRQNAAALKDRARIVLVLPQGSAIPTSALTDFWRVEYIPFATLSKHPGALLRYLPNLLTGSMALRRMITRDHSRHLVLNDFYLMQGALLRLMGYPGHIASWVRCDPKRFAGPLARPILWLTRKSTNQMIAVSNYVQGLLPQGYANDVLYDFYSSTARAPRVWDVAEEKRFIYVGNYIAGKGQNVALEAFAMAAAKDATLRLNFYGSDMGLQKNRDYLESLKDRAKQLGLAGRVEFHGFATDITPHLHRAFASLNCSVSESFSFTVLEASGAGLPVIATRSGGPEEIVQEGVTGYLVPVGDVASIAERIMKLANDPALAANLGNTGAAYIQAHFSKANLLKKLPTAFGL